jgi:hypothetical protein
MDTPIVAGLIAAGGTILAAATTVILTRILSSKKSAPAATDATERRSVPTNASECEDSLRQDARIQRLLNNNNWKDAADAAIAYFARGTQCSIESWKKSSTWQQVKVVFEERCAHST